MLNIPKIVEAAKQHEKLFIALDRDGTLVPYAKHPKDALMSQSVVDLLKKL
jgi:trehalose-6-phosphatase